MLLLLLLADGLLQLQVRLDDQITDSFMDVEPVPLPAVTHTRRGGAAFLSMEV